MFLKMNMCSVVPLPLRNLACSLRSVKSTASTSHIIITLQNTLLGTDSSVIPLQLLQPDRFPFLEILTMVPHVQSCGSCSCSQIPSNRGRITSAARSGLIFNSSACNESCPRVLLFFSALIALMISCLVGASVRMSRSSVAGAISGGFSGAGLFRISEKCSSYLLSCSSSEVNIVPCLSLTGVLLCRFPPQIC